MQKARDHQQPPYMCFVDQRCIPWKISAKFPRTVHKQNNEQNDQFLQLLHF